MTTEQYEINVRGCKIQLTDSQIKQIKDYELDIEKHSKTWQRLLKFLGFKKCKGYQIYENENLGWVADLLNDGKIHYVIMHGIKNTHHSGYAFWAPKELKDYILNKK